MHKVPNRRSAVKAISVLSFSSAILPKQWKTPLVNSIVLPIHAKTSTTNTPPTTVQACNGNLAVHYYLIDVDPDTLPYPAPGTNEIAATFEVIDYGSSDPTALGTNAVYQDNTGLKVTTTNSGLTVSFATTSSYFVSYTASCGGQGSTSNAYTVKALASNPNGAPGFYMLGYDIFWSTDQDDTTTFNLDNFSLYYDPI